MPSEMIPEDDRLALARALRNVRGESGSGDPDEARDDIARLFDDEIQEQAPAKSPRRMPRVKLLHALVALLAVACLALIVPLALDFFGGGGEDEVKVIQAEPQPEKVRPEEPGGLEVPYQDKLVMNQGDPIEQEASVERLLEPPEAPQPITPQEPETAIEQQQQIAAVPSVVMPEAASPSDRITTDEPSLTTASKPGEQPATIEAQPADPGPATPPVAAPSAPAPAAEPEPTITPRSPTVAQAPTEPGEAEAVESTTPSAPATSVAGISPDSFFIQLGSLANEEAVATEWARLQNAFPDLLGDMDLVVQTVTLEDRGTFHRVQTGPFPNRGTAEDMCGLVKAGDQACLVVKR